MNKPGFTLLELVVYSTLFSFFSLSLFGFYVTIQHFCYKQTRDRSAQLQNALVVDAIYKDLISACNKTFLWDVKNVVFVKQILTSTGAPQQVAVCWEPLKDSCGRSCLRRSEGVYDFFRRLWRRRQINIIYCSLQRLSISLRLTKDHQKVHSVILTAHSYNQESDVRYAVLRNRDVIV